MYYFTFSSRFGATVYKPKMDGQARMFSDVLSLEVTCGHSNLNYVPGLSLIRLTIPLLQVACKGQGRICKFRPFVDPESPKVVIYIYLVMTNNLNKWPTPTQLSCTAYHCSLSGQSGFSSFNVDYNFIPSALHLPVLIRKAFEKDWLLVSELGLGK